MNTNSSKLNYKAGSGTLSNTSSAHEAIVVAEPRSGIKDSMRIKNYSAISRFRETGVVAVTKRGGT